MDINEYFVKEDFIKKILSIAVIIAIIYSLKSLANMILFTFLFTFIFYNIQKLIFNLLHRYFPIVNKKGITISIYVITCIIIAFLSYKYIPILIKQLIIINHQISRFSIQNYNGSIHNSILKTFRNIDIKSYIKTSSAQLLESLTDIGQWIMDVFLSLILSLLFNLEKDEILNFIRRFQTSKLNFIYSFFSYFGKTFLNIFGKILQTQMIISFINSVLSFFWLSILGFHQALGLAFIILILGLIPIAGVIISLIPLSILAFKFGGISKVINILIMIVVLHSIESYILEPKLMSMRIKMPVFITFMILIVAEHLMGIWGLLFGIPLFVFLLDLVGIHV